MLQLKNIKKSYKIGEEKQQVLSDINIQFRQKEFVSILGASGSGKTTLLNIIGGLDAYDDGDLIIDGVSTKKYKSSDWNAYRNNKIGFVFQNYNLIMHQSVLSNVEIALTLSGVSKKERTKKAKDILVSVGLKDHMKKLPNQLSGGQMQRVAIARALVNEPDIILADEPTGALDSKTSLQIMDLLKETCKDKLIIMVTHNPELANVYSTRIVELKDGKILSDTNPYNEKIIKKDNKVRKTSMSLITSLGLSFKNLLNKKGRTALTAIAGSIGIIGIALVLSLSNGLKSYVSNLEKSSSSEYPIKVEKEKVNLFGSISNLSKEIPKSSEENTLISYDDISETLNKNKDDLFIVKNNILELKKYITNNEEFTKYTKDIRYTYNIDLQLFSKTNDKYIKVSPIDSIIGNNEDSSSNSLFLELPNKENLLKESYDLLYGKLPTSKNEVVLIINDDGNIPDSFLYSLNIKNRDKLKELINNINNNKILSIENEKIKYDDIIGLNFKLITKLDYYKLENNIAKSYENDTEYMKNIIEQGEDIEIVGIIKPKGGSTDNYIGYTPELSEFIINKLENNEITKKQKENININILTNEPFDGVLNTYENTISNLGIITKDDITSIDFYPNDSKDKEKIIKLIEEYNDTRSDESLKVEYTDTMQDFVGIVGNTINIISYVIIAFVAISLIVSSIMIAIITYISVLERTKEIGILRAIGASRSDITRVFRAETIIEGAFSGILGVAITLIINAIVNIILKVFFKMSSLAILPISSIILLILLSIFLTVVAGAIPSKMASKKNPVEALRNE